MRVLGLPSLVAGFMALTPAAALAQAPHTSQPIFRSGVDLVRFDVRVTDGSGRPIKDLRQDEIEIVEDGAPRPILLFQHFEEPASAYGEAALRAVSASRALPATIVSARTSSSGEPQASSNARASSMPGSVSRTVGISASMTTS